MEVPFLSVVIPAFNEEGRIGATLEQVSRFLSGQRYEWEIVVADDGSTDGTARLVKEFTVSHSQRIVLVPLSHGGKGWAVKNGMLRASGKFRFLCDADLSMPVDQLPRFLPPALNDFDVAIGSREAPGARRYGEPWRRHLMGRGFNLLVRLLAVPGLSDTQCGFKCFTSETAGRLFPQQRLMGFGFDAEILLMAHRSGMRIVEVPIPWYYRSQSKVRPLVDTFTMMRDLVSIRWNYIRGRYRLSSHRPGVRS